MKDNKGNKSRKTESENPVFPIAVFNRLLGNAHDLRVLFSRIRIVEIQQEVAIMLRQQLASPPMFDFTHYNRSFVVFHFGYCNLPRGCMDIRFAAR